MSGFKSGVVHEGLAVSDLDTQLATLQGFKESEEWEGLFNVSKESGYVAPHFCDYEPTGDLMMVKDASGKNVMVKSYTVESRNMAGKDAMKIRHFMGKCKDCSKIKMVGVMCD